MKTTKPMKLFEVYGELIVAKDKKDALRVMREEWGETFPLKQVRHTVAITSDGEDIMLMRPSEVVRKFPRGIVPEG